MNFCVFKTKEGCWTRSCKLCDVPLGHLSTPNYVIFVNFWIFKVWGRLLNRSTCGYQIGEIQWLENVWFSILATSRCQNWYFPTFGFSKCKNAYPPPLGTKTSSYCLTLDFSSVKLIVIFGHLLMLNCAILHTIFWAWRWLWQGDFKNFVPLCHLTFKSLITYTFGFSKFGKGC